MTWLKHVHCESELKCSNAKTIAPPSILLVLSVDVGSGNYVIACRHSNERSGTSYWTCITQINGRNNYLITIISHENKIPFHYNDLDIHYNDRDLLYFQVI